MEKMETLLDKMIALTFARHAELSEDEYLEKLGLAEQKEKGEEALVRNAKFAVLSAITREILAENEKMKLIDATFNLIFDKDGKKTSAKGRVEMELADLKVKIEKLEKFFLTKVYEELSEEQKNLLTEQHSIMEAYIAVLNRRLEKKEKKGE